MEIEGFLRNRRSDQRIGFGVVIVNIIELRQLDVGVALPPVEQREHLAPAVQPLEVNSLRQRDVLHAKVRLIGLVTELEWIMLRAQNPGVQRVPLAGEAGPCHVTDENIGRDAVAVTGRTLRRIANAGSRRRGRVPADH